MTAPARSVDDDHATIEKSGARLSCGAEHLSWKWDWAAEMVAISKELDFPFMAGSSLPTAWRMPPVDMPYGAEVEEALTVSIGSVDSYDFHALDALQCMLERRNGGETGILSVQAARGEQVWRQMEKGSWESGGWSPRLAADGRRREADRDRALARGALRRGV